MTNDKYAKAYIEVLEILKYYKGVPVMAQW